MVESSASRRRKRRRTKTIRTLVLAGILVSASVAAFLILSPVVVKSLTIEAGEPLPPAAAFILKENKTGSYETNGALIDTSKPGLYPVTVTVGKKQYPSELMIQDTIAPTAKASRVVTWVGRVVKEEEFVSEVSDITAVTLSFLDKPDTSIPGKRVVTVILRDEAGNTTEVSSQMQVYQAAEQLNVGLNYDKNTILASHFVMDVAGEDTGLFELETDLETIDFGTEGRHVVVLKTGEVKTGSVLCLTKQMPRETRPEAVRIGSPDSEPPLITGELDRKVFIGDTVSYRSGVLAVDNRDGEVTLQVDASAVDTKSEGEYQVVYSAVDASGNRATVHGKVTVYQVSREQIYEMADDVLAKIIKDNMSGRDKAQAIFTWVQTHIAYVNSSVKENAVYGAYRGFKDRRGDCYIYYAVAEMLLTRTQIDNLPVKRIPGSRSSHYWSLVNVGDGWYHFDTTPHIKGGNTFLLTESQAKTYTRQRGRDYYEYDRSLYPEVKP